MKNVKPKLRADGWSVSALETAQIYLENLESAMRETNNKLKIKRSRGGKVSKNSLVGQVNGWGKQELHGCLGHVICESDKNILV